MKDTRKGEDDGRRSKPRHRPEHRRPGVFHGRAMRDHDRRQKCPMVGGPQPSKADRAHVQHVVGEDREQVDCALRYCVEVERDLAEDDFRLPHEPHARQKCGKICRFSRLFRGCPFTANISRQNVKVRCGIQNVRTGRPHESQAHDQPAQRRPGNRRNRTLPPFQVAALAKIPSGRSCGSSADRAGQPIACVGRRETGARKAGMAYPVTFVPGDGVGPSCPRRLGASWKAPASSSNGTSRRPAPTSWTSTARRCPSTSSSRSGEPRSPSRARSRPRSARASAA